MHIKNVHIDKKIKPGSNLNKRDTKYTFQFFLLNRLLDTKSPLIRKNVITAKLPEYVKFNILAIKSLRPVASIKHGACPYITIEANKSLITSKLLWLIV